MVDREIGPEERIASRMIDNSHLEKKTAEVIVKDIRYCTCITDLDHGTPGMVLLSSLSRDGVR